METSELKEFLHYGFTSCTSLLALFFWNRSFEMISIQVSTEIVWLIIIDNLSSVCTCITNMHTAEQNCCCVMAPVVHEEHSHSALHGGIPRPGPYGFQADVQSRWGTLTRLFFDSWHPSTLSPHLKFGRTFSRRGDQSRVGRGAGAHYCPLCAASPASEEAAPELLGLTQQRQQMAQHPAQQSLHEFCIQTVMSGPAVAGTLVLAPSRDIPSGSTQLQFLQQSPLQPVPRKGTIKVKQTWFMIFLFPIQFTTWPHKLLSCRTGGRSNQPGGKLFKQPLQLLPTESWCGAAASEEILGPD